MSNQNFILKKTPKNISTYFYPEYNDNHSKMPKNMFREYSNFSHKKKLFPYKSNINPSFKNSYAPYLYYKNPADKNTFLVNYNGGPQKQLFPYLTRDELPHILNNEETNYGINNQYGYLSKNSKPRLSRNLSQYDNLMYNQNYNNPRVSNNQYNSFYKKIYSATPNKRNIRNFRGLTPEPIREKKNGKIIYRLKKSYNEEGDSNEYNEFDIIDNLRYEDNRIKFKKKISGNGINMKKFSSTYFNFRPRLDKRFHKSQIFNNCKPFLVDQFQAFHEGNSIIDN